MFGFAQGMKEKGIDVPGARRWRRAQRRLDTWLRERVPTVWDKGHVVLKFTVRPILTDILTVKV
jgi:hypothetical protein